MLDYDEIEKLAVQGQLVVSILDDDSGIILTYAPDQDIDNVLHIELSKEDLPKFILNLIDAQEYFEDQSLTILEDHRQN